MATEDKSLQVQALPKNIADSVLQRVEHFKQAGELKIPADYSPENALKSAHLALLETKNKDGKPALEVCTKESIANAFLKMIVLGLSVMKKQCDFIVRGNQLCCDPEYTGNIALAIRYGGLKHHKANAIFKGDVFKFEVAEDGRKRLIEHKQSLESFGGEVVGAYVVYELDNGTKDMEIMNIVQIRNAWMQGGSKGNSNAHKNFSDQMAIKTVYNRMTKLLIRASNDAPLMADSGSDDNEQKIIGSEAKQEVIEKANAETISFEDVPTEPKGETEWIDTTPAPADSQTDMPY